MSELKAEMFQTGDLPRVGNYAHLPKQLMDLLNPSATPESIDAVVASGENSPSAEAKDVQDSEQWPQFFDDRKNVLKGRWGYNSSWLPHKSTRASAVQFPLPRLSVLDKLSQVGQKGQMALAVGTFLEAMKQQLEHHELMDGKSGVLLAHDKLADSLKTIAKMEHSHAQQSCMAEVLPLIKTDQDVKLMLMIGELHRVWPCLFSRLMRLSFARGLLNADLLRVEMDWREVMMGVMESRLSSQGVLLLYFTSNLGKCMHQDLMSELVARNAWETLSQICRCMPVRPHTTRYIRKAFRHSSSGLDLAKCTDTPTLASILLRLNLEDLTIQVHKRIRSPCGMFHAGVCQQNFCEQNVCDDPDYDYQDGRPADHSRRNEELLTLSPEARAKLLEAAAKNEEFFTLMVHWPRAVNGVYERALSEEQWGIVDACVEFYKANPERMDTVRNWRREDIARLPLVKLTALAFEQLDMFADAGVRAQDLSIKDLKKAFLDFDEKVLDVLTRMGMDWNKMIPCALAAEPKHLEFLVKNGASDFELYSVQLTLEQARVVAAVVSPQWLAQKDMAVLDDDGDKAFLYEAFGWLPLQQVVCAAPERFGELFEQIKAQN